MTRRGARKLLTHLRETAQSLTDPTELAAVTRLTEKLEDFLERYR